MSCVYLSYLYFLNIVIFALLTIYILYKNPHSWVNRFCAAFIFCYFAWNIGLFSSTLNLEPDRIRFIINLSSVGWIWFSPFLLMFSIFYANKRKLIESKIFYFIVFLPALFLSIMQWQGKLFYGYTLINNSLALNWSGNGIFVFYVAYYLILVLFVFIILSTYRRHTKLTIIKKQINIIIISGMITLFLGTFTDIIFPGLGINNFTIFGDMAIMAWVVGMLYAMERYNFLGVTPALAAQNIIATMSELMILIDMKGKISSVNDATLELLKYRKDEIEGVMLETLFTKKEFVNLIFDSAKRRKPIKNEEIILRAKDKQGIPVIFSTTVLRDEMDDAVGIACLARDIVEVKKVQDELRETVRELKQSEKSISEAYNDLSVLEKQLEGEHNRMAAMFSNFSDPVIFMNNDGRIQLFNPEAKKIFDIKEKAMNEKIAKTGNFALENFSKIINRKYTVKRGDEVKFAGENEEELEVEVNDQKMIFKVITRDVVDRGYFLGTMKIFTNLTREKEIDKLKSEFITIAAHQLRTPLTAIKWVIKSVMSGETGPVNEEQKQYLLKGYESNERIINLVNDMLDVSRIEEGRFGYNFSELNFLETLNEVVENLKPQIDSKKIALNIKTPKEVPLMTLDRAKITLVLQNILENAVKYTPNSGKIDVEIKTTTKQLKVTVRDNGVGVPEEDQKKIFSKFFRAQNVMRMETEGSGLGLFIVKNIINKHGGEIGFKSVEGKGTEFFFELPLNNKLT